MRYDQQLIRWKAENRIAYLSLVVQSWMSGFVVACAVVVIIHELSV
jgi:hypothetical protein